MNIKFQKAWKFYFWLSLVALAAGLLLEFRMEATESSFADIALNIFSYVVEIVTLVCLYGYAWQVRFGREIFWQVFFFVSLGFFGYSFSELMAPDVEELLSSNIIVILLAALMLLLFLLQLLVTYLYAFHSKPLWVKVP